MRLVPALAAGTLMVMLLPACTDHLAPVAADPFSVRKLPAEVAPDARALVESNNRFALDLYARLRTQQGNLFLSPHSISEAFGMVCAGAAGDTRTEIARVFHFDTLGARLHPAFGALHRSLDRGVALGGYQLHVANRMWLQRGFAVVPDFRDITLNHYLAGVDSADFETAPEPARLAINGWVEQQTNQKIRDLLQPGTISAATRLVLANAIYFKGLWQVPFDAKKTQTGTFHLHGGATASVPMMTRTDTVQFGSDTEAQVLSLPYKGGDLSMVLVLPVARDGLPALEAGLSYERLQGWMALLHTEETLVTLPRFTFSSSFGLNQVLQDMGMPGAFQAGAADFSGIDGQRDLFISAAVHKAFVQVNEEGTEAAAATAVVFDKTSLPPTFRADHPFLFFIVDHVTGSWLFMGRVEDPR